jgi:hypothetical protein
MDGARLGDAGFPIATTVAPATGEPVSSPTTEPVRLWPETAMDRIPSAIAVAPIYDVLIFSLL